MRSLLVIIFLGFAFQSLKSQYIFDCGTDQNNDFGNGEIEFNYLRNISQGLIKSTRGQTTVLPVIVHIIHNNGVENISDAQIKKGIEYLNSAFKNDGIFQSILGVDVEVQFCLSSRKPDGSPTDGIDRFISEDTDMSIKKDINTNPNIIQWDPFSYINIWVVKDACKFNNCNAVGYAYPPQYHGKYGDGIVVEASDFGNSKENASVLIHEMGHYLGLLHTFDNGCKNENCLTDGDKVCDTPPDKFVAPSIPCLTTDNSCVTDDDDPSINNPYRSISLGGIGEQFDMNRNYMDYVDLNCYEQFTTGQKKRIHFFIDNVRNSLLSSSACLPPCLNAAKANFSMNKTDYQSGEPINVINNSINNLTNEWYIKNKLISTNFTPDLSILSHGSYKLKLLVKSSDILCDADSVVKNFKIICPVSAILNYILKDSLLIIEDKSINQITSSFILDKDGIFLKKFTTKRDSFEIEAGSYELCLEAGNAFCNDTVCKVFSLLPSGSEICDNSLDDDRDGYVDLFDQDCSCADTLYNGGCISDCEFVPSSFQKTQMDLAWMTPVISNYNDSYPNFVIDNINNKLITPYVNGKLPNFENGLKSYELNSGKFISKLKYNDMYYASYGHIANFVYKNTVYFVTDKGKSDFIVTDENGNTIWQDLPFKHDYSTPRIPKIADFNYDGIPEIYGSDVIINSTTGAILFKGNFAKGCNPSEGNILFCANFASSICGDLTPNPGLELACGNVVYQPLISNLNGEVGNTSIQIVAPPPIKDGITSLADIDLDGKLDVVVVRNNQYNDGGLWVWNPRNVSLIASGPVRTKFNISGFSEGGIPFVGNVDDDCYPEIGVTFINELRMYKYDGSTTLKIMYILPTSDNSGFTGITMFDFNQDGKNELIYRDETYLRIIEGATGITIDSFEIHSGTGAEYPIVSDIDDDGQAEILVNGFLPSEPDSLRIFCFESASTPWAPARKVWNQTGYHITNVNDDLTIPRQEQNNAAFFDTDSCAQKTCHQPYNSFMCQATYRDQNGCVKWPAVDMMADIIDYTCMGDSVTIQVEVRNQSTNTFKQDSVNIALFSNSDNLPFYFKQLSWNKTKKADTLFFILSNVGLNKIKARVNIPDLNTSFTSNIKGLTQVLECDYDNNKDSLVIDLAKKTLDLGPDITKCRTQAFTLHAGNDFVSYLWSDGSQDSTYTVSEAGIHKVVTYDKCNRKYEDEVAIKIDNALIPFIADIEKCEGDTIDIQTTTGFNIVQWLPAQNVVCDTCNATKIIGDIAFTLIMVTDKNGCIDADTAIVSIKPLQKKTISSSICEGNTFNFYNKIISTTGQYVHKTGQCDSLITLNIKINKKDTITLNQQICKGDSIQVFGKWYSDAINASFKGTNILGCDSIVNVSLSVLDTLRSTNKVMICNGDSTYIQNKWIKSAGTYKFNFKSTRGCDSIASYDLTVLPKYISQKTYSLCKDDNIKIGNIIYDKAGVYNQKWKTAQGCDSLLNITITLLPSPISKDTLSLCSGDSILVFGTYKKTSGTFNKTFTAANGCDSTATITLSLIPLASSKDTIAICEGDSIKLFDKYISKAGLYSQKYKSNTGCDSTATILLSISPFIREAKTIKLCEGDTILLGGIAISQAGTYIDTTIINGNCKKITSQKVEIVSTITKSLSYVLCPDDSIKIHNTYYASAGTYSIPLQTTIGCDSIITATIAKLSWPKMPWILVDCENHIYKANAIPLDLWEYLWPNGSTSSSYNFNTDEKLIVKATTPNGCETTFTLQPPKIPLLSEIPSFTDKNLTSGKGIQLSVPLDEKNWRILWGPSDLVSCDTCFKTTITTDRDTTIAVLLEHESGCTYLKNFRLIVNDTSVISLPNIFHPGSSNGNNAWTITLPSGFTFSEAEIYDRWGSKVFSTKNADQVSWDGTFNGQAVMAGVYVYQIKIIDKGGKVIVKVGDVTVVR